MKDDETKSKKDEPARRLRTVGNQQSRRRAPSAGQSSEDPTSSLMDSLAYASNPYPDIVGYMRLTISLLLYGSHCPVKAG